MGWVATSDETTGDFAAQLAARSSTPGGGAAAAVQLAFGAALAVMVARFTDGPKYADHASIVAAVVANGERIRATALELADADGEAFAAVLDAYRLDKGNPDRANHIEAALRAAAQVPADVIAAAGEVIGLAERLLPIGNPNVITDAAAAAAAASAAIVTSRVNIEINLASAQDPATADRFAATLAAVDGLLARADRVTTTVREGLAR